jgi:hypothetical protein
MSDWISELARRLVVGHKRDGRSIYDEQAKRELVLACREPGVSIAKLARDCGVNAIGDDRGARETAVFRFDEGLKVYLHREAIDFRVGLNGLAILVEQSLGLDPFAEAVYVFRNQRRDRVKILGWQRNGLWLLMKRLEEDRFIWPDFATVPTLTVEQLHWLLDGIDLAVVQKHPRRFYQRLA